MPMGKDELEKAVAALVKIAEDETVENDDRIRAATAVLDHAGTILDHRTT